MIVREDFHEVSQAACRPVSLDFLNIPVGCVREDNQTGISACPMRDQPDFIDCSRGVNSSDFPLLEQNGVADRVSGTIQFKALPGSVWVDLNGFHEDGAVSG